MEDGFERRQRREDPTRQRAMLAERTAPGLGGAQSWTVPRERDERGTATWARRSRAAGQRRRVRSAAASVVVLRVDTGSRTDGSDASASVRVSGGW